MPGTRSATHFRTNIKTKKRSPPTAAPSKSAPTSPRRSTTSAYPFAPPVAGTKRWGPCQTVAVEPIFPDGHNNLASALKHIGQFSEAELEYRKTLELRPDFAQAHSNLIMLLHYAPGKSPQEILAEMRAWNDQHARPLAHLRKPQDRNRDPRRKLRIGYVSPDFTGHIVGLNLLPLFLNHDPNEFEIYCYFNGPKEDEFTLNFKKAAALRDIRRLSDQAAAELIRQDQIDILVDLAGHTADNRLLVFAQKPAPIQITFGGYPGGTGLETMDWRLTDPHLDPPGQTEIHYVEKLYRLRDSFWCYDPAAMIPAAELQIAPLPASQNGFITFGCLNNFMKVTETTVQAWAATVKSVPASRFLMLAPEGSPRHAFRRFSPNPASPIAWNSSVSNIERTTSKPITESTWASTRSPTTATPPVSTPCGWASPS